MKQMSYQEVVAAIRKDIGTRWFGPKQAGREELRNALRDNLGLDEVRADEILQAMIEDGTLHYVQDRLAVGEHAPAETRDAPIDDVVAAPVLPGGVVGTFPTGTTTPVVPAVAYEGTYDGYWELRTGDEDADTFGRKGQVQPS
ncbi:MAG TPA: hypothetical protein VFT99_18955 [Roseiflexaceae bacterium]|nr:hypothetical protein [Roseiflexaceae bacterium]